MVEDRKKVLLSDFFIFCGYYKPYVVREYKNNSRLFAKGTLTIERNYWLIYIYIPFLFKGQSSLYFRRTPCEYVTIVDLKNVQK